MPKPDYKLILWNELARTNRVSESEIVHRRGRAVINVDCPVCGTHLIEETPKVISMSVRVWCENCDFEGQRIRGKLSE